MSWNRSGFRGITAALLVIALISVAGAQEKKPEQKADEPRKGTVTGIVVNKGDNWIEIKADGEEKARRYVPHWRGGLPAAGGGPDKTIIAAIKVTPLNARVRMEWSFEERPRVDKIEVLKATDEKQK